MQDLAGGEPVDPLRPRLVEAVLRRASTAVKRVTYKNSRTSGGTNQVKNSSSAPTNNAPAGRQNMRALEQANRIRLARAELERRIAKGDVAVADVLLDPSDEIAGMELYELLTSQKRW